MKTFEDLEAWKLARELRKAISKLVKTFPKDERFRLVDQIIRSSRSVPANIAEGFGRFHFQENIQFCRQARGSLSETLEHLICALDEEYIDEATFQSHRELIEHCWKVLNGYIAYLKKAVKTK
jgi:four helix bundle protein